MLQLKCLISLILLLNISKYINCKEEFDLHLRITGGETVNIKDAKHHVAVLTDDNYICGGSLITYKKVITAAHCLFSKDKNENVYQLRVGSLKIFAGNSDISIIDGNFFESEVISVLIHPYFDHSLSVLEHDLAILTIETEVPKNHSTISIIKLQTLPAKVGTACNITGWGRTSYENTELPQYLMAAEVKIQDVRTCNTSYQGYVRTGMICSGVMSGGIDACPGDSGGSLVCGDLLTGIISFGYKCGVRNYPGVYVDIVYYLDWILTNDASSLNACKMYLLFSIFFVFEMSFIIYH